MDLIQNVNMKNISLSSLPVFHGKSIEDSDTFLFKFKILCQSYNYLHDSHKLKLFPSTLKDSTLGWFMELGEFSIRTWDEMKIPSYINIRIIAGPKIPIMKFSRCNNMKKKVWNTFWSSLITFFRNLNIIPSKKMLSEHSS